MINQIPNHKSQITKKTPKKFGIWSLRFGASKKGYTLIELLIYMAIFVVLLSVLLQIFSSTLDSQLSSEANSSVQIDGRYLLSRFAYDIERSQNITLPANLGDTGSALTLTIGGTSYSYTQSSGNLQITTGGTSDNLNGYDTTVSGLSFQRLGNAGGVNTITISFTLTSKTTVNSRAETRTFQTTVATR